MGGPDGEMGLGGRVSLRHLTTRCPPTPAPHRRPSRPGGPPRIAARTGCGEGTGPMSHGMPGRLSGRLGMAICRLPKRPHGGPHD